jgi:signal transduction histidine kinase
MFLRIFATHNAILIGVLILAIALWIYFGNRQRPRNITMSSLLIASAFWSFSHVLWRASTEPLQALFWLKVLACISVLLPALLLFYVLSLRHGRMPSTVAQSATLLPALIFFYLIFGTEYVIAINAKGETVFGVGIFAAGLYFGVVFLLALLFLLQAARQKSVDRRTLLTTFLGSILSFNVVFSVLVTLLSYHDLRAFWIANGALAVGMLIIAMPTVGRRMLKDIRLIGGELFLLLVITLVVTDVVVSESLLDFTFRLVILLVIVFYGVIILRSLVREVSRLHQVERLSVKLGRVNRDLIEADKMKTRFLSFASHQLRSPLSGITSYLHMFKDGDFGRVTKKQKDVLDMNIEAMERLYRTIDTFLNVSKIEMGGLELQLIETNLELLIADVIKELAPTARKKKIKLNLQATKKAPLVMVDSGKLYHALANLIDNAIKYTNEGEVRVAVRATGRNVEIAVADTGHGMSRQQIQKIKNVMERGLEEIRFDKGGGSGLGIHIARKIVEGHGGKLLIMSPGEGKGSTFTIQLPRS